MLGVGWYAGCAATVCALQLGCIEPSPLSIGLLSILQQLQSGHPAAALVFGRHGASSGCLSVRLRCEPVLRALRLELRDCMASEWSEKRARGGGGQ